MTSIYLAGPLFSAAEMRFNVELSEFLKKNGFEVFLPQMECLNKSTEEIYQICKAGVEAANVVVAIMDGADADSGTCWECGYAAAKNTPIILVRTDIRDSGDTRGFNAMLYYSAFAVVEERINYAEKILEVLKKLPS
ncbi:nucleoside 2-deoxyribosyltransferase [Arcticibacter sp. MXS-1]|uniref:nucleoside 2-deoxyribosyltransferase n=1 Tax=Arcticibacter sp. MXS-1 TaxID=3341726 RepID=UPI0035A8704D